jgi:hypothetical protein
MGIYHPFYKLPKINFNLPHNELCGVKPQGGEFPIERA